MLVTAGVAIAGLTILDQVGAWRAFFAVEAVLAGIIFLCRLSLPESARWNMSRGRNAEAAEAIARILPSERAKLKQLAATAGEAVHNVSKLPQEPQPLGIGALFSPAYRTRTILVSVPWFLMDVATYGVGLFTPIILGGMALSGRLGGPVASDFADTKGTGAIDLFLLIGSLLSLWVVPRFGRMRMQNLGFVGMTVGILLFATLQQGGPVFFFRRPPLPACPRTARPARRSARPRRRIPALALPARSAWRWRGEQPGDSAPRSAVPRRPQPGGRGPGGGGGRGGAGAGAMVATFPRHSVAAAAPEACARGGSAP